MTSSAGGLNRLVQLALSGNSKKINTTASFGMEVTGTMHLRHACRGRIGKSSPKINATRTTQMVCGVTMNVAMPWPGWIIPGTMNPLYA